MRLTCSVEVLNRMLPTMNMKNKSKAAHTQLSIGKKPGSVDGTLFLMMCTAKDRNGAKFVINDNIEQIFARFVSEGKATIRVREPPQDISISKADSLQLKNFLSVLRLGAQGKSLDNVTLSCLAPASGKNVEKPKTRLVINSRKEYPLTTNFPSRLEFLHVSQCRLKKVDSRMLKLHCLVELNLSDNVLESLPEDFSNVPNLRSLTLVQNNLNNISPKFFLQSTLQNNLRFLDLGQNQFEVLPLQICELQGLVTLKIDNNQLKYLPPTIGRLKCMKFLSATGNKIETLPASMTQLQLETIDLYGNPFQQDVHNDLPDRFPDITLMECCARSIRKHRVRYTEEDLHTHLCRYLDSARVCWCGEFCFRCSVNFTTNLSLSRIAHTVSAVDQLGRTNVPMMSFLCSPQCLSRFQKNPHAYWKK
ncbi:leucine-rich repeat protein 1-like [Mizuhopecten yessoensis]|uniref:Leucine-rich repeat protein 1 n=1 Tax=Mizuhopecten yessoensis TaxID=6573 RepID=A0A210PQC1_MIZYE|nr:leucine-rich repeat protein 1-like [Mizuhopecten yessoensis]OWF38646.1 Leucine-rich repeat protein 1 [Mizuhopecten yessoensis]